MEMRQINILGISETKISDSKLHFAFQDHRKYKCFASSPSTDTSANGVAIIMDKELAKHVGKIEKHDGRIIALHMLFQKCKL